MNRFTVLFFSFLLLGCTSSPGEKSSANKAITVYYNNDNFGYLEPCGCRVSPIGSMHRRWNAMLYTPTSQRVFLDAGNTFFKSTNPPDYLREQWLEQAKGVVEAYNLLKATAITPGETDFALGTNTYLNLVKAGDFKVVSANLVRKETGKLLFPASTIVEKNGVRLGIFGVYSPDLSLPDDLSALPAISSAKAEVQKLKNEKVDLIIALSHQGFEQDKNLAQSVAGIDLIVGANTQSLLQDVYMVNGTQLVQLSSQGQMLGYIRYEHTAGRVQSVENKVAELNAEFDNSPDPKVANPMKNLVAITNIRIAAANKKLDDKLWLAHQGNNSQYRTFLQCRDCHNSQAQFQEGHPHSAAFLTLIAKKQERKLDCIKCHSVGFQQNGGFSNLSEAFLDKDGRSVDYEKIIRSANLDQLSENGRSYRSKDNSLVRPEVSRWIAALKQAGVEKSFVSVQCENCHGLKEGHPFGEAQSKPKPVQEKVCLQCHTQEQMPDWYDNKGKVKLQEVTKAMKKLACPR